MGSPGWEFDDHFSSLLEKDESSNDTGTYKEYVDEVEEELYYQVYFDRTDESKMDESSSAFKVEEVSQVFKNKNGKALETDGEKDSESENSEQNSVSSTGQKHTPGKVSKISNALESAGMSIIELKKILKQNDSENTSASSSSDGDSSGSESDDEGESSKDAESDDMHVNFGCSDNPADEMLVEIFKHMPDSPSWWRVDECSSEEYMRSRSKCTNCNDRGHTSYFCTKPKRALKCILCSSDTHRLNKCPQQLCFRCHQKGHQTKQCSALLKEFTCLRCKVRGHLAKECPDVWRQYHLTTSRQGGVVEEVQRKGHGGVVYCCNCARQGHLEHMCKDRRMNTFYTSTSPFIFNYDSGTRPLANNSPHPLHTMPNRHNSMERTHIRYDNSLFDEENPTPVSSKRGFLNKLNNNNHLIINYSNINNYSNNYSNDNNNSLRTGNKPGSGVKVIVSSRSDRDLVGGAKAFANSKTNLCDLHKKRIQINLKGPVKPAMLEGDYVGLEGVGEDMRRSRSDGNLPTLNHLPPEQPPFVPKKMNTSSAKKRNKFKNKNSSDNFNIFDGNSTRNNNNNNNFRAVKTDQNNFQKTPFSQDKDYRRRNESRGNIPKNRNNNNNNNNLIETYTDKPGGRMFNQDKDYRAYGSRSSRAVDSASNTHNGNRGCTDDKPPGKARKRSFRRYYEGNDFPRGDAVQEGGKRQAARLQQVDQANFSRDSNNFSGFNSNQVITKNSWKNRNKFRN